MIRCQVIAVAVAVAVVAVVAVAVVVADGRVICFESCVLDKPGSSGILLDLAAVEACCFPNLVLGQVRR